MHLDLSQTIVRIEKCILQGKLPRVIGHNARLGMHGASFQDPVVRVHTSGGATGIGWSRIDAVQAQQLLGKRIDELFRLPGGCLEAGCLIDLVLWDLVARMAEVPLYKLLGAGGTREVEVYDGSIYIDDLNATDAEAVEIFREEVRCGQEQGFTNFKIKIGRGARWMDHQQGLARDILVIQTVREAAGPQAKILIDANMGCTLNTAKIILRECADVGIYWFEEPFAEDPVLNQNLHDFIKSEGYATLIADGEFAPPPSFFDLVEKGWLDVVQHDFRRYGLTWWRQTADQIQPWGALCGPHCWGSYIDRFAQGHFAASIPHYALLESAPAQVPGLILDGWQLQDGKLIVPDTPGTGFDVEPTLFEQGTMQPEGFSLST